MFLEVRSPVGCCVSYPRQKRPKHGERDIGTQLMPMEHWIGSDELFQVPADQDDTSKGWLWASEEGNIAVITVCLPQSLPCSSTCCLCDYPLL